MRADEVPEDLPVVPAREKRRYRGQTRREADIMGGIRVEIQVLNV
jgi:hypothetical protein